MLLQETSNLKRINFSNLRDIKIKIEIETDCKPLVPGMEIFYEKLFKKGHSSLSYNNTIIKKIEQSSENEETQNKKSLSVGEFLNSIKTESDNDCDYVSIVRYLFILLGLIFQSSDNFYLKKKMVF